MPHEPPRARKHTSNLDKHGIRRTDPYRWMEDLQSSEMLAHLDAENRYAAAVLTSQKSLEESLYTEMLARIQESDQSLPVRFGGWMYYSRTETGAQYAIHCRKRLSDDGTWECSPEEVLLDENKEAKNTRFYELGDYEVSPSGRYVAWTEDRTGQRCYRLRIRDLAKNKDLRQFRTGVTSLCWAADDFTLFYVTEDSKTQRACQLWRMALHEPRDTPIHYERDERFNLLVFKTRSLEYVVLSASSHTTSEVRILRSTTPSGRWRLVRRRKAGIEYEVDHHSDHLLLRVNDDGPNFRLLKLPLPLTTQTSHEVLIPHREDVILDAVEVYRDWLVTNERVKGSPRLTVTGLADGKSHSIVFQDPAFVVDLEELPEWETPILRYAYESLTTPDSVFEYDPATRTSTLLRRQPVLGGFDPSQYRSERIAAQAADGTNIPISLVYRAGLKRDGRAPLWLEGYGAYGLANDPWFSSTRLSLLDRGWVFAIAHVRGGGDLGQAWHEAGRLEHKRNSFTDFICCAETLVANAYTSMGRILAQGGSAGGLLIAAVLNMRPELFGAAILEVPFVDVLTTMLNPALPLTVGEYEEWGNPERKQDFLRILGYSPYDNLSAQNYPPLLIETGLHDTQVMAWEPAKYVAKLRETKTDHNPVLLLTNMAAGHGGASGRYDTLRERARQLAFALRSIPADPT